MSESGEEQFIPALSDENEAVRRYAAQILGIASELEVPAFLIMTLKSGSPPARRAAAESLGNLGDAAAVPDWSLLWRTPTGKPEPAPPVPSEIWA